MKLELYFLFPNRLNLIYLTLILHGIGTLMPWNMFITAKEVRKFKTKYININTFMKENLAANKDILTYGMKYFLRS